MKNYSIYLMLLCFSFTSIHAQRALSEEINYYDVRLPNNPFEGTVKTYKVIVQTPYKLTAEEVNAQSLVDFEQEKLDYASLVAESELEFDTKLANYDEEVKLAKERYEQEMKEFKDLSLIECLAITDQGK